MQPSQRQLARAYLWLYSADIDFSRLDTQGRDLATSLGILLDKCEEDGRRESATQFLKVTQSGEYAVAQLLTDTHHTGEIDINLEDDPDDVTSDEPTRPYSRDKLQEVIDLFTPTERDTRRVRRTGS